MANLTRDQVERIFFDTRNSKAVSKDFGISVSAVQKIWSKHSHKEITKGLIKPNRYNRNQRKAVKINLDDMAQLLFCKPWTQV